MNKDGTCILGIESSCDDTSAAVLCEGQVRSNVVYSQDIHRKHGGVVPELASRAHVAKIVPVVLEALEKAAIEASNLDAIAVTCGPGLAGSLMAGASFAKGFALGLNLPLIPVNHMEAHVLAHFIDCETPVELLPMLCLTVSGGHTQLVHVSEQYELRIIGETLDDAAGEAYDKGAKMMGLPYPGGPVIQQLALGGRPDAYPFPVPRAGGFNYSFSGLKTSLLNTLKQRFPGGFSAETTEAADLAASWQHAINRYLMLVFEQAFRAGTYRSAGLAGGVSANRDLRERMQAFCKNNHTRCSLPAFEYCTDNAAMIAFAGSLQLHTQKGSNRGFKTQPRYPIGGVKTE